MFLERLLETTASFHPASLFQLLSRQETEASEIPAFWHRQHFLASGCHSIQLLFASLPCHQHRFVIYALLKQSKRAAELVLLQCWDRHCRIVLLSIQNLKTRILPLFFQAKWFVQVHCLLQGKADCLPSSCPPRLGFQWDNQHVSFLQGKDSQGCISMHWEPLEKVRPLLLVP